MENLCTAEIMLLLGDNLSLGLSLVRVSHIRQAHRRVTSATYVESCKREIDWRREMNQRRLWEKYEKEAEKRESGILNLNLGGGAVEFW